MAGWGRRKSKRSSSRRHKPAEARRALTAKLRGRFLPRGVFYGCYVKKKNHSYLKYRQAHFIFEFWGSLILCQPNKLQQESHPLRAGEERALVLLTLLTRQGHLTCLHPL